MKEGHAHRSFLPSDGGPFFWCPRGRCVFHFCVLSLFLPITRQISPLFQSQSQVVLIVFSHQRIFLQFPFARATQWGVRSCLFPPAFNPKHNPKLKRTKSERGRMGATPTKPVSLKSPYFPSFVILRDFYLEELLTEIESEERKRAFFIFGSRHCFITFLFQRRRELF